MRFEYEKTLGADFIAKIFRLFKPMLVQYIIFWKTDPNTSLKETMLNFPRVNLDNPYLRDMEISDEREYLLVHLQMDIRPKSKQPSTDGWIEVTHDDIKHVMNITKRLIDKGFTNPKRHPPNLKLIGTYQIIITGAEDDYWTKSRIDIHKFKIDSDGLDSSMRLRDIEAENNLTTLNNQLFGGKHILADNLENLKLPSTIYGLGDSSTEEFQKLPRSFLLSLTVDKKVTNKDQIELQNKQYILTINTIISNFGRLLVYLAKLIDLNNDDFKIISSQSHDIRENALKLQMKINDLLVTKSDSSTSSTNSERQLKLESDETFSYHGMEENLLLEASRYLSYLTEINQLQARANYTRQEATLNMEKINQTFGLAPIPMLTESKSEIRSLSSEFKQLGNTINYNFQNLKIELDHSQSTIRNTVDILKTFLESEQRIVSQRSGEAINWIVIVFAGLGLADALGNFVIFWLEGGSWYQAIIWFFVIIITLILIIVVLYFWYFKRPRSFKSLVS